MGTKRESGEAMREQRSTVPAETVADSATRKGSLLRSWRESTLSGPDPEPSQFFLCANSQSVVCVLEKSSTEPASGWALETELGRVGSESRQGERTHGFCFKVEDWHRKSSPSTMEERLSCRKPNSSSEKLPPLLSFKSDDSLLSLELSLKTEGPHAGNSSPANLSASGEAEVEPKLSGAVDSLHLVKPLRTSERRHHHDMRPFQPNFVKLEEPAAMPSASCRNFSPGVCKAEARTCPSGTAVEEMQRRELPGETSNSADQQKFQELLSGNPGRGQFPLNPVAVKTEPTEELARELMPSCLDQSKVSCTLEKIEVALHRSQFGGKEGHNLGRTPTASMHINIPSWCTKISSSPQSASHLVPTPPRSASPTTSDASSAASSRSAALHLSAAAVMSFQGEDLDGPGAGGGGACASGIDTNPASPLAPRREEHIRLDVVGCQSCHMYVMVSSDYPRCPKCGSTALLSVPSPPSRKKRRVNVGIDASAQAGMRVIHPGRLSPPIIDRADGDLDSRY